jgi:hypothetical protein
MMMKRRSDLTIALLAMRSDSSVLIRPRDDADAPMVYALPGEMEARVNTAAHEQREAGRSSPCRYDPARGQIPPSAAAEGRTPSACWNAEQPA